MINFPVFDELKIEGYGLFPGDEESEPGLHVQFQPGLTLILGSNGLGKTTLVTILYRMLVGPADIAGLSSRAELGYISLQATSLSSSARAVFARRVSDGARNASARLRFNLGTHRILVERRISSHKLFG
jgi:ATPase subunit of ABC transporter with duplicated ATPase domains